METWQVLVFVITTCRGLEEPLEEVSLSICAVST